MTAEIGIHDGDLEQVVEMVFVTMMGTEAAPAADGAGGKIPAGAFTAEVRMAGAWEGAVRIDFPATLACRLTASFLGIEEPAGVNADVLDVLGEVANMIAGNLKGLLRPGIRISAPWVREHEPAPPQTICRRARFDTADGSFWMTLAGAQSPN